MYSLTKNLRKRAAILIAVAYAFCVLAPTATLAFADNPTVSRCLSNTSVISNSAEHGGTALTHTDVAVHQHEQNGALDHHSNTDGKADAGNCCGLFCVSALPHDSGLTFGLSALASTSVTTFANGLTGRAPLPLHRPPIA